MGSPWNIVDEIETKQRIKQSPIETKQKPRKFLDQYQGICNLTMKVTMFCEYFFELQKKRVTGFKVIE